MELDVYHINKSFSKGVKGRPKLYAPMEEKVSAELLEKNHKMSRTSEETKLCCLRGERPLGIRQMNAN